MSTILRPGQIVQAESAGVGCQVEAFLGAGGQGEVYRARLGETSLALKWYFAESATAAQRAALQTLVSKGSPSEQMLWPLDLTSARGVAGFGYLMPLRPPRFRSGVDLVRRRIDPTFRALASAALHLANGFLQLHASGLAYRDISFGNLFLDPASGEVLICDLDNVGIDGQPHNAIGGTLRFMAPEIVRGEAVPSTQSDQFSLAVLLHFLFFMAHPLEGQREANITCLDPAAQVRLYGTEAVYVADPNDKSNRPVPGRHDNFLSYWPIYPRFFKTLFGRAFTVGLRDPASRVKESEWRTALVQLRDCIFYCGKCGAENFFDPETGKAGGRGGACWSCGQPTQPPMSLHIGSTTVMLNHDTRLYPHHLDDRCRQDFSRVVAEVSRHPTNPDVWGLKNLSESEWVCMLPVGTNQPVPPGRNVTLAPGIRIQFGRTEGEVKFLERDKTGAG